MTTDIKERLRTAAAEIRTEGHDGWGNTADDAIAHIEQLEGQLSTQTAEPVAWRREWDGDVSDLNNYVYASCEEELDTFGEWQPLYTHPAKTEQPSLSDAEILALCQRVSDSMPRDRTWNDTLIAIARELLAQRQDSDKDAEPVETGIYAWICDGSAALVMVNKRPSDHSPGGILKGHVIESTRFYDGCAVDQWTSGKWFGPLRTAIANGAPK